MQGNNTEYPKELFYNNNDRHDQNQNIQFAKLMEENHYILLGMEIDYYFNQIFAFVENNPELSDYFGKVDICIDEDDLSSFSSSFSMYSSSIALEEKENGSVLQTNVNWGEKIEDDVNYTLTNNACCYLNDQYCFPYGTDSIQISLDQDMKFNEELILSLLPNVYKIYKQKYSIEKNVGLTQNKKEKPKHL